MQSEPYPNQLIVGNLKLLVVPQQTRLVLRQTKDLSVHVCHLVLQSLYLTLITGCSGSLEHVVTVLLLQDLVVLL